MTDKKRRFIYCLAGGLFLFVFMLFGECVASDPCAPSYVYDIRSDRCVSEEK